MEDGRHLNYAQPPSAAGAPSGYLDLQPPPLLQSDAATPAGQSDDDNQGDENAGDEDVSMLEDAEESPSEVKKSPPETSESTPAVISDNPLDAPDAPLPDAAEEDYQDEDMGGIGEESKDGDSPQKDENGLPVSPPAEGEGPHTQLSQNKASVELSAREHLYKQTHAIVMPSYSTWFDMHKIHSLEKKALPEFFNNRNRSKTPAVYKDYRDFIINTYRLNPSEYLTVTACRRNLAGDIDPDSRPSNIGPPFTGHFLITADTPRGLQSFQPTPTSTVTPGKPYSGTDRALNQSTASLANMNLEIRRNIYDRNGKDLTPQESRSGDNRQANGEASAANGTPAVNPMKSIEDAVKITKKSVNCYSCGVDCSRIRWQEAKSDTAVQAAGRPKYELCPNCYLGGRFPSTITSVEFIKIEDPAYSTVPDRDAPWTDLELLNLLTALERDEVSWDEVADKVETRTREECIMKFLQLEIEDKYLEGEPGTTGSGSLGALRGGRIPLSTADNPVMTVVAFLAGMGDPRVAAAVSTRGSEEMRKSMREKLERGFNVSENGVSGGSSSKDKGKTIKGSASNDEASQSMDIDHEGDPSTPNHAPAVQEPATSINTTATAGMISASTIALASTGTRASALASHEERQMTSLVNSALNKMLEKFELKLTQFSEMEAVLQAERRELERGRQQLFLDRLAFKLRVREVQEGLRLASLRGGEEGARMALEVPGLVASSAERFAFQPKQPHRAKEGEIRPLSADMPPGFRTHEI
ncbi:MAG: hypothetical protein M1829_002188 [Trizodia sp. TS-e1964]|nr:MAG: hypothetical protein M1829_002188 [Trizodia sp. TS-e1964]